MKEEGKKAAFSLIDYSITDFSFKEPPEDSASTISVEFDPSGIYDVENEIYYLAFKSRCFTKDPDADIVTCNMIAQFKMLEVKSLEEIPTYFYRNSIAIIFPYLRAFISTLTAQANLKPLIIPILNLSDLEKPLMENTTIMEMK